MVTAADLRGARPRRAFRGYERTTADELLERLASTLEESEAACASLRERESALRQELEEGESFDRRIRETMVAAQREIDRMELEAKREAQALRERVRIETLESEAALEEEHETVAARLAEVRAIESDLRTRTRALVEEALRELSGEPVGTPGALAPADDVQPPAIEQTQPIPVLSPLAEDGAEESADVEPADEPRDTLTFAVPQTEEGPVEIDAVAESAHPTRRRSLVLSFAILFAGALVAVGIWQLSSAGGASKASASPGDSGPVTSTRAAEPEPATEPAPPTETVAPPETVAEQAAEPAAVVTPPTAVLAVKASAGDCWLQVRAGSAKGKLLYDGFLYQGDSEHFQGRRLWVRFGNPGNVTATLGGKPIENLPTGTGDMIVTAEGVRVVSLG